MFADLKDDNGSDSGINFDYNDPDMPNNIDVDLDVPTYLDEIIAATPKSTHGTHDGIDTHESLDDDLCWLHQVSFCNGSIIHLHLWGYSPFASVLYSCVATNILVAM